MVTNSNNPFEKRAIEKQNQNPFERRLAEKNKASDSLWDGMMNLLFSKEETPFEYGLGSAARGILPSIGGIPGDLIQTLKLTAQKDPNEVQKFGQKMLENFPTTQELQEKYDLQTQGKYQPKSRGEDFSQQVGGDIASLLLPVNNIGKAAKAVGIALGSNLAKEGVKELGFGKTTQEATKLGTMFLMSMFNPKGASKYTQQLYQKASSELPKDAFIPAKNFSDKLDILDSRLSKGLKNVQSKAPVIDAIQDIRRNVKNGHVNINDLITGKINLNEQRTSKIFDPELRGKNVRKDLVKNYGELAKAIDDSIAQYGKSNPAFFKYYKDANAAFGGIEQSKKASKVIQRVLAKIPSKPLSLLVYSIFSPESIPYTASSLALGYGGLKSYEMMHRIMMNPTLRKYYMNTVIQASKDNASGTLKSLKKLHDNLSED